MRAAGSSDANPRTLMLFLYVLLAVIYTFAKAGQSQRPRFKNSMSFLGSSRRCWYILHRIFCTPRGQDLPTGPAVLENFPPQPPATPQLSKRSKLRQKLYLNLGLTVLCLCLVLAMMVPLLSTFSCNFYSDFPEGPIVITVAFRRFYITVPLLFVAIDPQSALLDVIAYPDVWWVFLPCFLLTVALLVYLVLLACRIRRLSRRT